MTRRTRIFSGDRGPSSFASASAAGICEQLAVALPLPRPRPRPPLPRRPRRAAGSLIVTLDSSPSRVVSGVGTEVDA